MYNQLAIDRNRCRKLEYDASCSTSDACGGIVAKTQAIVLKCLLATFH